MNDCFRVIFFPVKLYRRRFIFEDSDIVSLRVTPIYIGM